MVLGGRRSGAHEVLSRGGAGTTPSVAAGPHADRRVPACGPHTRTAAAPRPRLPSSDT
ncbi:hypothetical protein SERN_1585 [Serinibacter arcticus]|uniref:Uncharacterized protein n=1 Tax=Serinibacter arcticus TaxID=1655435 RepID=A0A4Z1E7Q3_9MICO|nr:hypothetical protein SERN_1585 [Serinibacter arcticus]